MLLVWLTWSPSSTKPSSLPFTVSWKTRSLLRPSKMLLGFLSREISAGELSLLGARSLKPVVPWPEVVERRWGIFCYLPPLTRMFRGRMGKKARIDTSNSTNDQDWRRMEQEVKVLREQLTKLRNELSRAIDQIKSQKEKYSSMEREHRILSGNIPVCSASRILVDLNYLENLSATRTFSERNREGQVGCTNIASWWAPNWRTEGRDQETRERKGGRLQKGLQTSRTEG